LRQSRAEAVCTITLHLQRYKVNQPHVDNPLHQKRYD